MLHILRMYSQQFGEEEGDGCLLDFSLIQEAPASMVCASREWVNHLLRDWKKRGLLEHRGGRIILLDLAEIEAERDRCIGVD